MTQISQMVNAMRLDDRQFVAGWKRALKLVKGCEKKRRKKQWLPAKK